MKSPSQLKVSTLSFIVALMLSLFVFGIVAYFAISGINSNEPENKTEESEKDPSSNESEDVEVIPPEVIEEIKGENFSVLVAGYGLNEESFDAMVVVDVNKEEQRVSIHPINADTKVYVGHADGAGNINVRIGDLPKYRDMQYVVDKVKATTGLSVSGYVTFTAEGFIKAFDEFNADGDYVYTVPKDMEHLYFEESEETKEVTEEKPEEPAEEKFDFNDLNNYNISFKKGDKLTSGIDIYNMLRYKGDSNSERLTRQAAFVSDIIKKIIPTQFKEANLSKIITSVNALLKLADSIETDISAGTFITETFSLIAKMPEFSFNTTSKYTKGVTNFK